VYTVPATTLVEIAQLVGALRGLMGRAGVPPSPQVKRDAVEILVKSLQTDDESVRRTAAAQLRQLTGADLGDTAAEWEEWWRKNRDTFGKGP